MQAVVASLQQRLSEDFSDDEEKDHTEDTALAETAFFFDATDEERLLVEEMVSSASAVAEGSDSKFRILKDWIEKNMRNEKGWNQERLILFTEYRHTMQYLLREMEKQGWSDAIKTLYGGMESKNREAVKEAFQTDPAEEAVRILVATDAAAEGLNLQRHCRHLIHWEIPWNPNRMEQRNGRIDRHGQKADEVFCRHFVFANWEDQRFLNVVVDKVRTQRADLGSVGDVIAAQVEEALRGERKTITTPEDRSLRMKQELTSDKITRERIRELREQVSRARDEWHLDPDTLRMVLHEALRLVGHPGLSADEAEDHHWILRHLPAAWNECRQSIQDAQGRLVKLVFDQELVMGRKGVRLLHLDHPLLKRALAVFRANLWSVGLHESHKLHRCSYRVLPRKVLDQPVILLVARLVAVNSLGQKLHEDFLYCGGEIQKQDILHKDRETLQNLLNRSGEHPPLPSDVAQALRRYFPGHEQQLRQSMRQQADDQAKWVEEELARIKKEETAGVRKLINQRQREIAKRIKEMEKEQLSKQVQMFDLLEKEQHQRDLVWLRARQEELKAERDREPEAIAKRYTLRDKPQAFPLALLYLIPDHLLKGGK
ncbi:MAG: hypothetical protein JRF33_26835 [Deltaproteobacteria bacterium]|nr:hypothetical protein [Deltaproteobacteria bacterium]